MISDFINAVTAIVIVILTFLFILSPLIFIGWILWLIAQ